MPKFENSKIFFRLAAYVWRFKVYLLIGILGTMIASGIAAGFAWFLRPLLNQGFVSPNIHFIHWVPAIVIAAYCMLGLSAFVGDTFLALAARHVVMMLQRKLFDRFLNLPSNFFDQHSSGQLLAILVYNVEQVTNTCTTVLMTLFSDGFYLLGLLVVMFVNSWRLTLIFFVTIPFISIIVFITSRYMKRISLHIQHAVAEMTHIAEESIEGIKIIHSFGGKNYESGKFGRATKMILKKQVQLVMMNSAGISGARIIASFAIALTIFLAALPHAGLSIGAFMSIIASMLSALKPLRRLTQVNSDLQKGIAGAESVFEIFDTPIEQDKGTVSLARAKGKIEYRQVDFSYPARSHSVLKQITFTIEPGQRAALVGHSGSGKTTLINLLQRFYSPQSGQILLDGIDIQKFQLASLRAQFAVVSETISLVNDTIAHNIAYGCLSDIDHVQVEAAAKAAKLFDFIQSLPNGFETKIGENGVLLSAGQRQRLAIARAILKDAPILILDEATSGLDSEAEQHIHAALDSLMENCTTIIIAHRLSTVQKIDKTFVLNEGLMGDG